MANYTINPKHAAYGLNVFLVIGEKRVPIVSANIEFSINQIPIANVVIPSGIKMENGSKSDLFLESELAGRAPAQIKVTGVGRPHPVSSTATPVGDVTDLVIFDGYLAAKNVQFSVNGVSTTITLFHWLHDLDYTSAFTSTFVSATSNDWFRLEPNTEVNKTLIPFKLDRDKSVNQLDWREKDWWNDIVVPGLGYTSNLTRLSSFNLPIATQANEYTKRALPKMVGRLKLNENAKRGLTGSLLSLGIGNLFARTLQGVEGGSSNLEKLISLGREFQFMVAPRVKTCVVMPYNPTAKPVHIIPESEFDFGFSSSNPTVVPSGVIIYGVKNQIGVRSDPANKVDDYFLGSFRAPASSKIGGPLFTMPTPSWMTNLNIYKTAPDRQVVIAPDSQQPKAPVNAEPDQVADAQIFVNNYAKAVYFDNLFSAKIQEVICGFRTDIAPGDCIELRGDKSGLNVSGGPNSSWRKRGMVESVSYLLHSGDLPKINTVYRLRHVFDGSDIAAFEIEANASHPIFEDYVSNLKLEN
jgi:hypothetical protein